MIEIQKIKKIIETLENNQVYLELGDVSHELVYSLQKFNYNEWEFLSKQINQWNNLQRMILVDAILEIKENKASNFDTSIILAQSYILSDLIDSEVLIQNIDFLDNKIPKEIELIDKIYEKTKWLEKQSKKLKINFEEKYKLIFNLYGLA